MVHPSNCIRKARIQSDKKKGCCYETEVLKFAFLQISQQKACLGEAVKCHKKAEDDACEHLKCIKTTGECLHEAGVRLHHLPPEMVSILSY